MFNFSAQLTNRLRSTNQRRLFRLSMTGLALILIAIGGVIFITRSPRPTADIGPAVIPPVQNLKAYAVCLGGSQTNRSQLNPPRALAAGQSCLGRLDLWTVWDSPLGHEDSDLDYEVNLRYSSTVHENDPSYDERFWHVATIGSGGQEFDNNEGHIVPGSWLSTDKGMYIHADLPKDEVLDFDGAIYTVEVIAFDEHTQEASEGATVEVKFPLGSQPAPL